MEGRQVLEETGGCSVFLCVCHCVMCVSVSVYEYVCLSVSVYQCVLYMCVSV